MRRLVLAAMGAVAIAGWITVGTSDAQVSPGAPVSSSGGRGPTTGGERFRPASSNNLELSIRNAAVCYTRGDELWVDLVFTSTDLTSGYFAEIEYNDTQLDLTTTGYSATPFGFHFNPAPEESAPGVIQMDGAGNATLGSNTVLASLKFTVKATADEADNPLQFTFRAMPPAEFPSVLVTPSGLLLTGLSDSSEFAIDITPPVFTSFPVDVTTNCAASTNPVDLGTPGCSDNCDVSPVITAVDATTGGCPVDEVISREWTCTDSVGLTVTRTQTITLQDTTGPELVGTAGLLTEIECDEDDTPANTGTPVFLDDCNTTSLSHTDVVSNGLCTTNGLDVFRRIIRTWRAVDTCSNATEYVQTIVVKDTTMPVLNCPANITIDCAASINPTNTGTPGVADACDSMVTVGSDDVRSGSCPEVIFRTWSARDDCGNEAVCTQEITLIDTNGPELTDTTGLVNVVECGDDTTPATTGEPVFVDDCNTFDLTSNSVTSTGLCTTDGLKVHERIIRTWEAVDLCTNATQFVQTIVVEDTTPPTLTCPPPITRQCSDSLDASSTGFPVCDDSCTTCSFRMEDGPPITSTGVLSRVWIGEDDCGNESMCTQLITIIDSTDPVVLDCPAVTTVECDGSGNVAEFNAWLGLHLCEDDCTTVGYSTDHSGFTNDCGATSMALPDPITFTCTDLAGNSNSSCMSRFFIEDTVPPLITSCPVDITTNSDLGTCGTSLVLDSAVATDDCGGVTVTCEFSGATSGLCTPASTQFFDAGSTGVTWTVTDDCGNTSICSQSINVAAVNTIRGTVQFNCNLPNQPCSSGSDFDRCVRFIPIDAANSCGLAVDATLTFSTATINPPPVDPTAPTHVSTAMFDIQVECGDWSSLFVKDEQQTLGDETTVSPSGNDMFLADTTLELDPGDTNNDCLVFVDDLAFVVSCFGNAAAAGGCPWDGTRDADFDQTGQCGPDADLELIQATGLTFATCSCSSQLMAPLPLTAADGDYAEQSDPLVLTPLMVETTRLTAENIVELLPPGRRLWLDERDLPADVLAASDLNGDGRFDYRDVAILEETRGLPDTLSSELRLLTLTVEGPSYERSGR